MPAERVWHGKTTHRSAPHDEPFDAIRLGSIIRWNGRLRTVRELRRYPNGRIHSIGFAKLRKSTYNGPMTSYLRPEIRTSFGGIVAHRKGPLCAIDLECRLTQAIETDRDSGWAPLVHQDETVGVIW